MTHTERYRQQHAQIMTLATALGQQLVPTKLGADASSARQILSELSGKLIVHLASEDRHLYPKLLACPDTHAQALAQRFADEMGSIAGAFRAYVVRWGSTAAIQAKVAEFVSETRAIIKALADRIRRENSELYPLADKL